MKFILGKKIRMSQIFDEKGDVMPVTMIEAGPCRVLQIKTKDKDSYEAIQIGFEELKPGKVTKSKKTKPFRHLKEVRILGKETEKIKQGDEIDVSVFEKGDKIIISGISKGKGFAGAVKRWGFAGQTATHGTKHEQRTIGSVGSAFPQRVIKGRKMPGRMGADRVSVKNLKIIEIDKENNLMAVKGAVPGRKGTLLEIRG